MSYDSSNAQNNLGSYFEKSAGAVRVYADQLEHDYGRPAMNACADSFSSHPIFSTFFAIFSLLSILPVLTFLFFSLLAAGGILFFAFSAAIVGFIGIEIVFISLLLTVLSGLFALAVFLTTFAISIFLSFRLALLVRAYGLPGFSEWFLEITQYFSVPASASEQVHEQQQQHSDGTEGEGSLVVVKGEGETSEITGKEF